MQDTTLTFIVKQIGNGIHFLKMFKRNRKIIIGWGRESEFTMNRLYTAKGQEIEKEYRF